MTKGFMVTVISYTLFIILPFAYLLTSVNALLNNDTAVAMKVDKAHPEMKTVQVFKA